MKQIENPKQGASVKQIGTGMIIMGWLLALLLLTFFFDSILKDRANPNNAKVVEQQRGNQELVLRENANRQYVASGTLNGVATEFLVDTGASQIAISIELANRANLELGEVISVQTAGGVVQAWITRAREINIGPLRFTDVAVLVTEGLDNQALLGMNALSGVDFSREDGLLILQQRGFDQR